MSEVPLTALFAWSDCEAGKVLSIARKPSWSAQHDAAPLLRWRHRWLDDDGSTSLQIAVLDEFPLNQPGRHLLRAPGHCDFILDVASGTIAVDALPGLADNTLEHLLLDQAMPRLLAGMGHLVVHASIVRLRHRAIAFVGRSGWGKSTLAALFHRRGHPALCDDCALLEHRDGQVFATPSYPGLRLFSDSIDQALDSAMPSGPVSDYSDKQRIIGLDLPSNLAGPQPLAAICLLEDPKCCGDTISMEPIAPTAACMAVIEHGFRLDPTDAVGTVRQLASASAIAQAVPAFLLRHPRDFARQEELIALLLERFDTPEAPQP